MKTREQARKQINSVPEQEKQEILQMAQLVARIIERRQALGLTQKQLAERAGFDPPSRISSSCREFIAIGSTEKRRRLP